MSIFDILDKHKIKYEDLNTVERETLQKWSKQVAETIITPDKLKEYVSSMKDGVEQELANYDLPKEKDLLLKARLKNYLMFLAFLSGPEKARKFLEQSLSNLKQ